MFQRFFNIVFAIYEKLTPETYPTRLTKNDKKKLRLIHAKQIIDMKKKNGERAIK